MKVGGDAGGPRLRRELRCCWRIDPVLLSISSLSSKHIIVPFLPQIG